MFTQQFRILMMAPAIALGLAFTAQGEEGDAPASQPNVPPEGFTALFNGKDLSGWFGRDTEDPRKLWAMSKEELAAHQEKTLENVNQHWSVNDGELINDGHGLFLTTLKDYGDFELMVDYKTVALADSGIYLRGVPQVQIWDPTEEAKFNIGADKGSGGLWNNSAGTPGKDPLHKMDKPFGEWNAFRIVMIGERVSVWFNGKKVVDHARMENFFDRENPIFKKGPIQLQTHGGEIRWRNVFIREIDSEEANRVLQSRDDAGFVSLFNGVDLEGWQGAVNNYTVQGGTIMCKPGKGGTLLTNDEYSDFAFRFEFKTPPGGNNGVAVRAPLEGDPAWKAFEIQILDDTAEQYANLKDYQYNGSVYGSVPAKRGFSRNVGEWNYEEIRFKGSHITVELNGVTIVDKDLKEVDQSKLGQRPDGFDRTSGYVGFAGHSDPVQMRNVRMKKL
jgi:hypothetical protein